MANKNFFAPVRMESQFLDSDLFNVYFTTTGAATGNAAVADGTLVTLGDFAQDPIYASAYGVNAPAGFTTRFAQVAPITATTAYVVDLATVPTKTGGGNTIRDGYKTIGLTADAGVVVRARKLTVDDVFTTGEDNTTAVLVKGQFAIIGANGQWSPSATAPAGKLVAKVVDKFVTSQGVDGNVATGSGVTSYRLCIYPIA